MSGLSEDEWQIVFLTLGVAARSVAFGLPVAVLVAWLLVRGRFFGRPIVDAVAHLPMVLPPVVVGWLLLLIFGVEGPIGAWLQSWFGVRLVFTTAGAALACAVTAFPLMVRAIRLSLEAVDPKLEEAARTLGAKWLDRFFTITLPLAAPGVLVGAIVGFKPPPGSHLYRSPWRLQASWHLSGSRVASVFWLGHEPFGSISPSLSGSDDTN